MGRRTRPEVNAGSMADIAFLLLIFFLVTTTIETDTGLLRKLPPIEEAEEQPAVLKERNVFQILVNGNGELLVENRLMVLEDLTQAVIDFIDNGAGVGVDACTYCKGLKSSKSSENPQKAVISLANNRKTPYSVYIAVQNSLTAAYNTLRNRFALERYGVSYSDLKKDYNNVNYNDDRGLLKQKLATIKDAYPQKISEAEPK